MPTISPDSFAGLADITRAEQDVVPACSVIALVAGLIRNKQTPRSLFRPVRMTGRGRNHETVQPNSSLCFPLPQGVRGHGPRERMQLRWRGTRFLTSRRH